jgi:calcineurin-like phosphoesterase family protein/purple acid phosphatase-like protein
MDAARWRSRIGLILVVVATVGRGSDPMPGASRSTEETLRTIGRRLSGSWSERDLTAMATRGPAILDRLEPAERAALGRGYLRFRVDRPVVVEVSVPTDSVPFWLADRGFRATGRSLANPDATWQLHRRTFDCGWIELGVNGLDRTPVAHYVVFIRPSGETKTCREGRLVTLADGQEACWRTAVAQVGVSAAFDAWKPFKTLPEDLVGAVMLQASHTRRHSTLLATGRVWKTHVVSDRQPDQVAIAFGDHSARELVWTWRTSTDVEATALRIVRAPSSTGWVRPSGLGRPEGAIRIVSGDSSLIESPGLLNDPVVRRHRVSVADLVPDTVYWYALGDGTPQGWSPWKPVKTAPGRARPVRLLYLGDAQTGLERWGRLLETAARRHPDLDFVVLAGDLVDRGNERTNWDHLFLRAAPVFDRLPVMPCAGNHEYLDVGPRLYRAFFELPHNGPPGIAPKLVYSFEVGDACFAVLDSTLAVSDPASARRQAEWLDETFGRTKAAWKLVMFHHPVYPSHPWRDSPALRAHWVPIFDKHHVDLVLQGHDHAYLRTYPLRAHRRVERSEPGTVYVIAVSGDKYVDQAQRDYIEVGRAGVSTYQTIEIDPESNRLNYRAWTEDGRTIDELNIEKPRRAGRFERLGHSQRMILSTVAAARLIGKYSGRSSDE